MRPSGVPVCLMPVQKHELGEPASVVDIVVGVAWGVDLSVMTSFYLEDDLPQLYMYGILVTPTRTLYM